MLDQLIRAHYDPERLGLRELSFSVKLTTNEPKGRTEVAGRGTWRTGDVAPTIELSRVMRDGKLVDRSASKIDETVWTSMTYLARHQLAGIGHGFLSQRLEHFRALARGEARDPAASPDDVAARSDSPPPRPAASRPGRGAASRPAADDDALARGLVELVGDELQLTFDEPGAGRTTLLVGRGFRVLRVTNSTGGVTRTMTYEHTVRGGRYLVSNAKLQVEVDEQSPLSARARQAMRAGDGMTYRFTFAKVGRYLLPSRLQRATPAADTELEILLGYDRATP